MKFGIMFANVWTFGDPAGAIELAQAAEAAGFESLWTVEHVVIPKGYKSEYPYSPDGRMPGPDDMSMPDCLMWLAYVASATSTIRLGTGVLVLPQRNPVVLAKELATLDHMTGGRVELGIGAGWLAEEFEAIGVPFESRGARTDEHVEALRALWTQAPASYTGEHVAFHDVYSRPAPDQQSIPIVIGGHTKVAARRAGRLGDGFFPGTNDVSELLPVMREAAANAGRDADAIELTLPVEHISGQAAIDVVQNRIDQGASRVGVPSLLFAFSGEPLVDSLRRYADEVMAKFS